MKCSKKNAKEWEEKWGIAGYAKNIHKQSYSIHQTLEQFYSRYGKIVSTRILDQYLATFGFAYAIIELDDGSYGEAVILKLSNGKSYRIIPEQPFSRKNSFQMLSSELEQSIYACTDSTSNEIPPNLLLHTLNDDCLKEIFKYLPLSDLCSAAEVSRKFKRITKEMFPTQFGKKIIENPPEMVDLCKFESFLRNFGSEIKSLSFNAYPFRQHFNYSKLKLKLNKNAALLMLLTYCSGPECQLDNLILTLFDIGTHWSTWLRPIFNRLKRLTLDRSEINELFDACNELTHLNLIDVDRMTIENMLKVKKFEKLEDLSISGSSEDIYYILSHMQIHSSLKTLKISDFLLLDIITSNLPIFTEISSKFPNLEYLHFDSRLDLDNDRVKSQLMSSLNQMTHLKKIGLLKSHGRKDDNLLKYLSKSKTTIEWMILSNFTLDTNLETVTEFKELQELKLNLCSCGNIELSVIVRGLPNLTGLHLLGERSPKFWTKNDIKDVIKYGKNVRYLLINPCWNDFVIGDDDFDEMLGFVEKRKQKFHLKIEIYSSCSYDKVNVSRQKRLEHQDLLEIKLITFT